MFWTIIGISAATLTTFSFVPQIYRVAKTKSIKDLSLVMLLQFACGVSLWAIYGFYLKDNVIIFANIVTLVSLFILISQYFVYSKKKQERSNEDTTYGM